MDTGPPEFDHHSRFHAEHWHEIFRSARERDCPVLHSSCYGGYRVLTRHADVLAASNDWKHFSSERSWSADGTDDGLGTAIPPRIMRVGFLDMDPAEIPGLSQVHQPVVHAGQYQSRRRPDHRNR